MILTLFFQIDIIIKCDVENADHNKFLVFLLFSHTFFSFYKFVTNS